MDATTAMHTISAPYLRLHEYGAIARMDSCDNSPITGLCEDYNAANSTHHNTATSTNSRPHHIEHSHT